MVSIFTRICYRNHRILRIKTIILKIADDVYKELKSNQGLRMMVNASFGIQDEFIRKIISSIDNDITEVKIKYKKNKK